MAPFVCSHVQLLDVVDPDFLWDSFTYQSGQTKGVVDHFEARRLHLLEII